jgi:hypothetical protein
MSDAASISQALFALGHTVNCVSHMRGRARLTVGLQLYGRSHRLPASAKPKVDALWAEYEAKCLALGLNWTKPDHVPTLKVLNDDLHAKVNALKPAGREGGFPFHRKPVEVQLEALQEASGLIKNCTCGCKRNPRKSKMFVAEFTKAIEIYAKTAGDAGWAGLNLEEFLTKTFGAYNLQAMLK